MRAHVADGSKPEVVTSLRCVRFTPQKQTWRRSLMRSAKGRKSPLPNARPKVPISASGSRSTFNPDRKLLSNFSEVGQTVQNRSDRSDPCAESRPRFCGYRATEEITE